MLFTGGIPAESVEDVFRLLAGTVGSRAMSYPDGELNERGMWIGALKDAVWERCDQLERIPSALPEGTPEAEMFPSYRVKDGVTDVRLEGLLPYARSAVESYEIFARLRGEGVIDPQMRLQMAYPGALDAISLYFPRVEDWSVMLRAWTNALADEHRRILEAVPPSKLVVQIDYCLETSIIDGVLPETAHWVTPDMTGKAALERYTSNDYLAPHFAGLPDEVLAGYHICLGTFPKWPRVPIDDLSMPVAVVNALAANSGRRIDFFHLPVMADVDERFFAPLERLDVGDAAIYLGVECDDGDEAMQRRIADARKFLPTFGVAHYCGYSWKADVLPQLLSTLRAGADGQVAAMRAG
ncbi:MAG TPA: hypothetical protein VNT03_04345 [Baekduia sp.]|nr:hypothetical protein [Baekduia sp.]